MKKMFLLLLATLYVGLTMAVDMQAHIGTTEAANAYTDYVEKQEAYYTGAYTYDAFCQLTGNALFGQLTAKVSSHTNLGYKGLRYLYVNVDKDLNTPGNIIGYYDGSSMDGAWDGTTYNREHTWPQSKGADSKTAMGADMQSVRPANTHINGDRGNTAYGETGSYYDPDEVKIDNSTYRKENLGTYRGDCARVILYDYIVYGEQGGYKGSMYNGNAQLLSKLGGSGVFESLDVLLKWHCQDPPSLTEMVRNDGGQTAQGNRNPFIDYPDLALEIFSNKVSLNEVHCPKTVTMYPNYRHALNSGFIAYLTYEDGLHPDEVSIENAQFTYDATLGRLSVSRVYGIATMTVDGIMAGVNDDKDDDDGEGLMEVIADTHHAIYNLLGQRVSHMLPGEVYIVNGKKVIVWQ